jgi:predicted dinucleotide-binding enzyme
VRYGVLGTGTAGQTIATKLVGLGNEVMMGSRQAGGEKATAWAASAGELGSESTFKDAAAFGERIVNATAGGASLSVLESAGADNLAGKLLIDIANPLDFSRGMPPTLSVCNDDSLGEQIQRAHPDARVVKTLNTVNSAVMVDPSMFEQSTAIFVCGNDEAAKRDATELLESFGWLSQDIVDLGDIGAARGMEMFLPLWLRLYGAAGKAQFNIRIVQST